LRQQGKLYNGDGEIIAEGLCELDDDGLRVSMWPTLEKGLFEREKGLMTLELEGGSALCISERRLKLRINPSHGPRTAVYRMQVEHQPSEEPEGVPAHLRRADLPEQQPGPPAGQPSPPGGLSTAP
jgi:hypothetical protein